MNFIRPATPGFLVTLAATILLALVSFGVPLLKSIYFLKAKFSAGGYNGDITLGTLGYCLNLSNGTSCSTASVGYQLDVNALVDLPIQVPEVAIKWITYALVLHIVALGLAGGSAVFGLLAHVREMSMTCCSTFVSGFAAFVALVAFIFDLVFFFVAKARINSVPGGHAEMGIAIWLTLAAWLLLFFSGCFYTIGRCCIKKRPRGYNGNASLDSTTPFNNNNNHAEQMRLDAVKAEADRKARQKQLEVGLPAFYETQPLTGRVEGDAVYFDDPHSPTSGNHSSGTRPTQHSGYVQGAPGTRAVDEYYNPTTPASPVSNYAPRRQQSQHNAYPPQPNHMSRQPSTHTATSSSGYGEYSSPAASPPPMPNTQHLHINNQQRDNRMLAPQEQYGHTAAGTSYHSAASHQQFPSSYSHYDAPNHQDPYSYNNQNTYEYSNTAADSRREYQPQSYYTAHTTPIPAPQPQRQYTLGGAGYGESVVPDLVAHPSHPNAESLPYPGDNAHAPSYAPRGPRIPGTQSVSSGPDVPPPMYEATPGALPVRGEKN